jgi:phosphatidylserine decarboxylase
MRLGDRAFVALQYLLPKHAITALVYRLARARTRWLKRALIRGFMRLYAIELGDAAEPDAEGYASFNEFFTRALKDGARPLAAAAGAIASPCDGTVSERGTLDGERLLQARLAAKNRWYTLGELLGEAPAAVAFVGGEFATIYLAPYNYHRVHAPLGGRLTALRYLPGELFSVNRATAAAVPRLFARNERVVCRFEGESGPWALVFVGALNVGSIEIAGVGELTPARPRHVRSVPLPAAGLAFARGAELGRFNMGSTVILLLPRGSCRWSERCVPGAVLRMGEAIAVVGG